MAATKYRVIKTFDTPQGLKRPNQIVTFKSKKQADEHLIRGLVEKFTEPKISRKKKQIDAGKGDEKTVVEK